MTNSLLAAAHFTLTHRETGRVLLHDLCFSLMPGERLTVIGPSGSGKTLICRAILGQLSSQTFAASGALSFGGDDLLALGLRGRAVGAALQACLDAVMDEAVPNDRTALLAYAAENLQRFANS